MVRIFPAILFVLFVQIFSVSAISGSLPPRQQWNANHGYCGETSLISAGMHFGQYCSQFTARRLASPRASQADAESQLLIGVNDAKAAKAMKLHANEFDSRHQKSSGQFFAWIKRSIAKGFPTVIGVFCNAERFGTNSAEDEEYDHIVTVTGIDASGSPGAGLIRFSDHGLYAPGGSPVLSFCLPFAEFLHDRASANESAAPVYSLKDKPSHYGIAITGVADRDRVTVPVSLAASRNDEPEMRNGSNIPPKPAPMKLTATVSIPDESVAYNLYRYDSFEKVPVCAFNAAADKAAEMWHIPKRSGASFKVSHDTDTGATVVFRAVPDSAP